MIWKGIFFMKRKLINKIIVSFFTYVLCFSSISASVFAEPEPGEYYYLCSSIEDELFEEVYEDLLKGLEYKGLSLEIMCAKEYKNSFSRFKLKRDQISKSPDVIKPISTALSIFAPGGHKKLIEAMDILCKEEYDNFKERYASIPTAIYGSGDQEIASKRLCDGKYEIKLSRQGAYIIVKHFEQIDSCRDYNNVIYF